MLDYIPVTMAPGYPEVEAETHDVDVIVRVPRFSYKSSFSMILHPDLRDPHKLRTTIPTHTVLPEGIFTVVHRDDSPESAMGNKKVIYIGRKKERHLEGTKGGIFASRLQQTPSSSASKFQMCILSILIANITRVLMMILKSHIFL